MACWFNVAGPCRHDIHYMLPAMQRVPDVMRLIAQQSYFVLHAPPPDRQNHRDAEVEELVPTPAMPITTQIIEQAKEVLIARQDTHLDSLAERLREPRVRAIIEPMLAGLALGDVPVDDLRFVQDLGLVQPDPEGGLAVANPI